MGLVAKQSILNTIWTYVGFVFGAINTLFLFTLFFSKEEYGLVTYLTSISNLLWPFLSFGMHNSIIKFYNDYKLTQTENRFFSWLLIIPMITGLILGILYFLFYDQIYMYFQSKNAIVSPYVWLIYIFGFSTAYFELFFAWARINLASVKGNFMNEVFVRVTISILLALVFFKFISVHQFMLLLGLAYIVRAIVMIRIAYKAKPFYFSLQKIANTKEVATYALLILIATVVSRYMLDIDKAMIEYFRPISELPQYIIPVFIASVIGVPARALSQITTPLAAKFIANNQLKELNELNKKSSLNGLLIAGMIAVLILTNTHSIFQLVPRDYIFLFEIVLYITLVKVFDASLGVTNSILLNSDAYKWVLSFGVGVLILAFGLNLIFIPQQGIKGAALATLIAYVVFNIVKILFVKHYFKIHPFQLKSIGILFLLIVLGIAFYYLNFQELAPIVSIFIKGILTTIIFIILILKLKLSPEITLIVSRFFSR